MDRNYSKIPAFPHPAFDHEGLTKLEYFAGQALQGMCANSNLVYKDAIGVRIQPSMFEAALSMSLEMIKKLDEYENTGE